MDKNKELQSKFMEFKSLKEQIEQLQEYIKNTSSQMEHIKKTTANLKEITLLEKGSEILVPVTNGVFIKAKVADNKEFIVNIGSDTAVTKDLNGLLELMKNQERELSEVHARMVHDLDIIENRAIALQKEIQSIIE